MVPVKDREEYPSEIVEKLEQGAITTAEQVVATGATPGGIPSLAQHLGVSEEETRQVAAPARSRLAPDIAANLEEPVDTSRRGSWGRRALGPVAARAPESLVSGPFPLPGWGRRTGRSGAS